MRSKILLVGVVFVVAILLVYSLLRLGDRDFIAYATPEHAILDLENTSLGTHPVSINYSDNEYSAIGAFYYENGKFQEIGTRYANEKVATKQRPIASIAKVITALVVQSRLSISSNNPGDIVTISGNDENDWKKAVSQNETNLPVYSGASYTYAKMLQGMLTVSANNIANLLATSTFGSFANYKKAANEYLIAHNLNATTIGDDASGFDSSTTSSLKDLVELGKLTLEDNFLKDAVSHENIQWCASSGETNCSEYYSTNALLGTDGFVGIKTGFTDDAGGCFLFATKRQVQNTDVYLIGAVLGSPSVSTRFYIAKDIADSVDLQNSSDDTSFSSFSTSSWELGKIDVLQNTAVVAKYQTVCNGEVKAVVENPADLNSIIWSDDIKTGITYHFDALTRSTKFGDKIGTISFNKKDFPIVIQPSSSQKEAENGQSWFTKLRCKISGHGLS
ncbi:MAG: hypothetical protein LBI63_03105 [Candidatus Ancillula sp.]|nr:hypothetical protein [Candidatus Ancillula sp.]